jgi:hypothetical protein
MRVVLVLFLLAVIGGSGVGFFVMARKVNDLEDENAKLRHDVQVLFKEAAVAGKVDSMLANHQGQINAVRGEVGRMKDEYAVAEKVDKLMIDLHKDVSRMKTELAEVRKSPPPAPTHYVELGFRKDADTEVVLRYAGHSFNDAFSRWTVTKQGPRLGSMVTVDANNPRAGMAAFNYAVIRSPEGTRTVTLKDPPAVPVVRPAPNAADWDLPADSRTQVKKLLELGN